MTVAISPTFLILFPTAAASCELEAQPRQSVFGPVMSGDQVNFARNVRIPAEAIATTTLATFAVLLRFFSRWMKGLRYKRDDWMLAASMVSRLRTRGRALTDLVQVFLFALLFLLLMCRTSLTRVSKRRLTSTRSGLLWPWSTLLFSQSGSAGYP